MVVINNVEHTATMVSFLGHDFKWQKTETEMNISIDDDLIRCEKGVTLNNVWGNGVDSIHFANNWDQLKYYQYNDHEILVVRLLYTPCTGLGCSVNYFLVYDMKFKTKNFFGTFRTDMEINLYHFKVDREINYLSKTYVGGTDGVAREVTIEYNLYSLNPNGGIRQEKK